MPKRFAGKVAVVTGAATGLGRAFARAFTEEGAAVAVIDVDADGAKRTAAELDRPETPALALTGDVADEVSVSQAVDHIIERFGGIDLLVNNAARHLRRYNQPFSSLTNEEIRGLFDVNVLGVINCSVACRTSMAGRDGGAIVNISSAGGFMSTTPYGVTKLAVRGLTIAFATEFSDDHIRVNGVAPTMTATENLLDEYSDEEFERSVATRQLVRRRGTMDDITRTVLFLCSEDAAFITGETLRVTGGASLAI